MKPKKIAPRLDPNRKPSAAVRARARAVIATIERDDALERMHVAQAASRAAREQAERAMLAVAITNRQMEAVRQALGDAVILPPRPLEVSTQDLRAYAKGGMRSHISERFTGLTAFNPASNEPIESMKATYETLQLIDVELDRVPDWTRSRHYRLITRAGEQAYAVNFESLAMLLRTETIARIAETIDREVIDTYRRSTPRTFGPRNPRKY